jgi:ribose transport system permease protein
MSEKIRIKLSRFLHIGPIVMQNMIIFLLLVVVSFGMAALSDKFLTYSNFNNIIVQASMTIIAGTIVSLIIILGELDLSIGGVVAMSGVLYAYYCQAGIPVFPWAIILSIATSGLLVGIANGVLVAYARIPSFIVTLGMMYVARGVAYILAKGSTIGHGLPENFSHMGIKMIGSVPLPIIYTAVVFIGMLFLQTKTVFGRSIFVIGANPVAAELSGIPIALITVILYVISGIFAAFCGVMFTSRIAIGDCTIGSGFEFEVIIACVLGGNDSGRGSVVGMILGAILLRILNNGLNLIGLASYYQSIVSGAVLILAIASNKFLLAQFARISKN